MASVMANTEISGESRGSSGKCGLPWGRLGSLYFEWQLMKVVLAPPTEAASSELHNICMLCRDLHTCSLLTGKLSHGEPPPTPSTARP